MFGHSGTTDQFTNVPDAVGAAVTKALRISGTEEVTIVVYGPANDLFEVRAFPGGRIAVINLF